MISTLLGLLLVEKLRIPLNINLTDYIIGLIVGALLPDADHEKTWAGKIIPLWRIWKHRTVTHSIFSFMVPVLLVKLFPSLFYLWLGLFIGLFGHIVVDMLTPAGCPLLYPLNKTKFRFAQIDTGSLKEDMIMAAVMVITVYKFYGYLHVAAVSIVH
jgi:inner membrane protein